LGTEVGRHLHSAERTNDQSSRIDLEARQYQTSAGGDTRCPLEEACQLTFASATPLLAEVLSFKVMRSAA